MAKRMKRASASRKSSKRGKRSTKPSRKKATTRAASKKAKSKVRRTRAAKTRAKKEAPPQIAAAMEALRQAAEMSVATAVSNMIEERPPRRVVVTEHESVASPTSMATGGEPEREGHGPEAKPEAA